MNTEILSTVTSFSRVMLLAAWSYILNSVLSIQNFLAVILILATINIIYGWLADVVNEEEWSFRKALQAGCYLGGYFLLLILTNIIGSLMGVDNINYYCSWITWVMIYFYSTNILRNWKIIQPNNKVISFLYWVATAKFIKNINYMEDYLKQNKEKEVKDEKK